MIKIQTRKYIALLMATSYVIFTGVSMILSIPIPDAFAGLAGLIIGSYYGKSTALEVPGGYTLKSEEKTTQEEV